MPDDIAEIAEEMNQRMDDIYAGCFLTDADIKRIRKLLGPSPLLVVRQRKARAVLKSRPSHIHTK